MSSTLALHGSLAVPAARHEHDRLLAALMRDHERQLYSFILTLVRDADTAMDCIQDTFLRAYEALRKGKSINTAWLYTVARNRAMDEFRRKRRLHPDGEALEHLPVHQSSDESVDV